MKKTEITLSPFPRVYSSLQDVREKEVEKVTGARNTRLVIHDSHSFGFEDKEDPMNPKMKRICGVVDPKSKMDAHALENGEFIFVVDDDEVNRLFIVATDSLEDGMDAILRRASLK